MQDSQVWKRVLVYLLLLSTCVQGTLSQSGFVNPTVSPQTFPAATSTFTNSHAFPSTGGFGQTNAFSTNTATTFANSHALPVQSHAFPAQNHAFPAKGQTYYPPINHHAAKGYYPSTMGDYYSYPVNGQYWTGNLGQFYPGQYFSQVPMPYPQHGQHWPAAGHFMQPYYGFDQYGFSHSQTGYSNNFGHYPQFDANYWSGAIYHPAQIYMHPVPMHYPMQHQIYHPGHQVIYPGQYGHYPVLPYRKPWDRGFFGGTGSGLAKGLLGAVLVGVVAGKIARGK